MRERNPNEMRSRGGRASGTSGSWQDEQRQQGQHGRAGRMQAQGGRATWDRDRQQAGFDRDDTFDSAERGRTYGQGRGSYGEGYGAYGGERGQGGYSATAQGQGYAPDYEDEDYDPGAWPSAGRRDYGPAGYGSGTSFEREAGRAYAQRGDYTGQQSGYASGYGGQRERGMSGGESAYGESGYGQSSGRQSSGRGGSNFNDRWENAYAGSAYGSTGGHAGAQRQGFGQQSGMGLGRRGLGPKNYTRSDERIREDISERLSDDDELDASGIEVQVSQGVVTLTGTVEERWEKHRAEDIADGCSGVRDVQNQIRVGSSMQAASLSSQSAGSSTTGTGAAGTQTAGTRPGTSTQSGGASLSAGAGQTGTTPGASRPS